MRQITTERDTAFLTVQPISINELNPPTRVRQSIVHPTPSAAVPIKVHLRNQKPAVRVHFFNVRYMPRASRALHARLEDYCGTHSWHRRDLIATRPRSRCPELGIAHVHEILIAPLILRPPCALPKRPPIIPPRTIHRERVVSRHCRKCVGRRPWRKRRG